MQGQLVESYVRGSRGNPWCSDVLSSNPKTLRDCLLYCASHRAKQEAFVFCSMIKPRLAISWKDVYDKSCLMAMAYTKLGVKQGEVIAVVSQDCPEWIYAAYGALMAGIIVTSIAFGYEDGSDVIAAMSKLQKCSLMVLNPGPDDRNWSILKSLLDKYDNQGCVSSTKMPYLRNLVFTSPPIDVVQVNTISNLLAENCQVNLPYVDQDAISILITSSGSTGVPKFIALSQAITLKLGTFVPEYNACPIEFNTGPFGWIFPCGFLWGQTRVTISETYPSVEDQIAFVIDVIQRERCSQAFLLPPVIYQINKRHNTLPNDWPLETICTGGQPITKSLTACIGTVCKRLSITYDSTEIHSLAELAVDGENVNEFEDHLCGEVDEGVEMKIVDGSGNIVPVGEIGEIYVRCGWLFKEYFNDPEKTAAAKTPDGWFKMDDYGRMTADGSVFALGRVSDTIISGGKNVMPSVSESILESYHGVESVFAVPVMHHAMYQVICACVTLRSGFDITEAQLRQYIESRISEDENVFTVLPKYYLMIDKFPEGATGKVSRKALKRMAEERFGEKQD